MLDKTLGIVLSSVPYNDHSQFVHIYTEKFGKITYKVPIKQYRKSGQKRSAYTPMSLLELDVQHSESSEFQDIKEASILSSPLSAGMSDPIKYSQYLYLAELIDKSVREIEQNPGLWSLIYHSLEILSMPEYSSPLFHLLFTVHLFDHLGFGINSEGYEKGMQFDMKESCFTCDSIHHQYYLNGISAQYLHLLISSDYSSIRNIKMNDEQRKTMLNILLIYLQIHVPEIGNTQFDIIKDLL